MFRPSLEAASLIGADCRGADFGLVDLASERLWEHVFPTNMTGVRLMGADLRGANLDGARLVGANLAGANLQEADFTGADLTDADLRATDLTGARLVGANLTRSYFGGENPTRPDQLFGTSAHGLTQEQIREAKAPGGAPILNSTVDVETGAPLIWSP